MRNKKLIIMHEFLSGIDKLDHKDWKIITTNERKYIPNLVRKIAAVVSISMRLFSEKKAREHAMIINLFLSMIPLHADRPDRQVSMFAREMQLYQEELS